jgi:hypothetical protein
MGRKEASKTEKRILKELLEQEELLLKADRPKKKPLKNKEILAHLMDEAKKDYTQSDEATVNKLLSRTPKEKKPESEYAKHERAAEMHHKIELEKALEHYPRVHFMRIIKMAVVVFVIVCAILFFLARSGYIK